MDKQTNKQRTNKQTTRSKSEKHCTENFRKKRRQRRCTRPSEWFTLILFSIHRLYSIYYTMTIHTHTCLIFCEAPPSISVIKVHFPRLEQEAKANQDSGYCAGFRRHLHLHHYHHIYDHYHHIIIFIIIIIIIIIISIVPYCFLRRSWGFPVFGHRRHRFWSGSTRSGKDHQHHQNAQISPLFNPPSSFVHQTGQVRYTMQLTKGLHPHWTKDQVLSHFESFQLIKSILIPQCGALAGFPPSLPPPVSQTRLGDGN